MPNPVSSAEIEDVLSSIRRLVSDDPQTTRPRSEPVSPVSDRLVLTPAQRVTVQLDDVEAPDQSWEPATDEPDLAEIAEETAGDPADVGDALARVAADVANAYPANEEALSLEDRIAGLEAALGASEDEWEPDGSEDFSRDLTRPLSADTNFDMATAWRENPGLDESADAAPEAEHVPEPSPEPANATSYRLEDRLMAIDLTAVDRLLTETNSRAGGQAAPSREQGDETLFAESEVEEGETTTDVAEDLTPSDEHAAFAEDESGEASATGDEPALDAVEELFDDDDLAEAGSVSDERPVLAGEELETGGTAEGVLDPEQAFDADGRGPDDGTDAKPSTLEVAETDEIGDATDVESLETADTDLTTEELAVADLGAEDTILVEEEHAQPSEWIEEAESTDEPDFAVADEETAVTADAPEAADEEFAEELDELEAAETSDAAEDAETLILGEAEFVEETVADDAGEATDVTPLRLETVADDDTIADLEEPAGEEPLMLHPEDGIIADDGDVPLDEIADLVALDGAADAADAGEADDTTIDADAEPVADGLEDVLDTLGLDLEAEADTEIDAAGTEEGDGAVLDVSPDELSDVIEAAFGEEDTEASETPEAISASEDDAEAEAEVAAPAAEVPTADLDEDDAHEFDAIEEHVADVGSTDAADDIDVDTVAEAVAAALDQEVSDAVFAEFSRIDEDPEVADDAFIEDPEFLEVASLAEVEESEAAEKSDEAEAEEAPEPVSKEVGVDIDAVLSAMSTKAGGTAPLSEDTRAPDETPDDSESVVEEDAQSAEPADVPFVAARGASGATQTPTETPAAEADTTADLAAVASAAAGAASSSREAEDESIFAESAAMGEDALRDLVAQLVREELQGVLGERITRNVRRLVRREIERALSLRDLS